MILPPLRIGTRGSDLALWQARHVAARLAETLNLDAELVIVHTSGDRDRTRALHELPGSGFFTKELQRALSEEHVDLVVHSLKDLPIEEPEGLGLVAILERADPRDLLVAQPESVGDGGLGLRPGARLGTSSLRRAAQALGLQSDLAVLPLRGNVPTRLRRLREGDFDAVLVAKAGIDRLSLDLTGLSDRALDPQWFLPAPGQGALAIEVRLGDARTAPVGAFDDPVTAAATRCERAVLAGLGGGCHLPLGALARTGLHGLDVEVAWGEVDLDARHAKVRHARGAGATPDAAANAALAALGIGAPA
jgi:hydroxymethylbilane synthase